MTYGVPTPSPSRPRLKFTTLRSDRWWRTLGVACLAVAVLNAYWGYWLGTFAPAIASTLFFSMPRLLDSTWNMAWTVCTSRADDLLGGTARWDPERQELAPLIPDELRRAMWRDLLEQGRGKRAEHDRRANEMMRELAAMKDPTPEKVADLYRRHH